MPSSVWKGHLTFGLVSFPVTLSVAARGETISFNQLHKPDGSRVKLVTFCQKEDKPIPRNEIVKGYEYEKDHYVVIDDEEIKKVAPKTAKIMEILEFVKAADVDPVYLETSYYMAPGEGGEKPYALLFEAMKQTGYYAVAKIAMHNREHIIVIRPSHSGMMLHTMYYRSEIRAADEFRTDTSQIKDKELALARTLVESLADEFQPEKYHDTYRDNLEKMIHAKIEGHKVVETPTTHVAPVIDIMEALRKSLEQKKPPKRAEAATAEAEAAAEPEEAPAPRKRAGGQKRASRSSA
ncbi:Ku protein [Nevskia soli]|jgi:DNA end-binding protein Ku|uniref:non-homologous end joining protein Ku n=1 Tax=Nevskia soli TaxID=418856 RepID=UPI0015D7516A|nr:Ku protein [Nevskia soli]